jgi:hypothetical protein
MSSGISFLYSFDFGNRDVENPGSNILRVTSTAAGDFDKANLTTESTRHRWRSNDVLTLQEIVIKAEIKSKIDTFAILGHNFSSTAVVRLQGNVSDNWVAPPLNQVLVIDEDSENIIFCSDNVSGEYSYYRITILDPSNTCGYVEIGRIVGGRAFTFVNNEDITDSYTIGQEDKSEKAATQGFYKASNENVVVRTFSANFEKLFTISGSNQNFVNFKKMTKNVKTTRPFLTILNRDNPIVFNIWGQLSNLPSYSYGVNQFNSFPIQIEEVF